MGREIRQVPKGWEHPKDTNGKYKPLFKWDDLTGDRAEWDEGEAKWLNGLQYDWEIEDWGPIDKECTGMSFDEYSGCRPTYGDCVPHCPEEERTHIQMYETVSEGTPVSPVFATAEELIDYLVESGDFWDRSRGTGGRSREAATAFVKSGWAPSMVMQGATLKNGIDRPQLRVFGGLDMSNSKAFEEIGAHLQADEKKAKKLLQGRDRINRFRQRERYHNKKYGLVKLDVTVPVQTSHKIRELEALLMEEHEG